MKLSTVLFVIFCAGTLLVQVLVNLGFKKGYQEHLLFVKNQVFPINDFPLENIKVVVAKGVRFTLYVTKSQQGFKQDVRSEGITFTAQGDTLFISSKEGKYNERNYFETYFHAVPTLILTNANANISVNTNEELNTRIEKNGQLLVQKSRFRKINAEVKDSSALVFDADAMVDVLEVKLKDSAALRDKNANINKIIPTYISDKASLSLSGKGLRALQSPLPNAF
ncbi:hypothetical protein [Runella slithyformis]|uniref:Uncharacterized protein n=1 Tax=Runella slithyformis (strain ATCC 29530 / DSM 19594 / LMG 11500 / NCIMB 11436 / LSU 4) TaxID=761193 RepID=A0A7U3ZGZ8_RUNSL|nr:hypothetical protein [Runella slithyformis]AEI47059.1 hypothetical protein Runsl_0616 [Runella slithyformis DSM 19594]